MSAPQPIPGTSSSAPACTACPRPGTWPGSFRRAARAAARTSWCSTRPASARARRGSPAARSATTTSSPPCASSWPITCRCGSRPRGVLLPSGRLPADRARGHARGRACRSTSEQQAIGYDSVLVGGERDCLAYMQGMFPDWQATGATTVLHEKQGGYANNKRALAGLAAKARAAGVQDRGGRHSDRPAGVRRGGHRGRDGPRHHRLRPSSSRPGRGSATSGRCSGCRITST